MKRNETISPMTLGTVQLGLDYGIANREGKPGKDKAYTILDEALVRGVNCLDTAAGYGDSEQVIGGYLRHIGRNPFKIATKFKIGDTDGDPGAMLRKSVEKSLSNLGVGRLDFLLMHDAAEYGIYGKEIDREIQKLMDEGLVDKAGASGYSYGAIEPLLEKGLYEVFQLPFNLMDHRIDKTTQKKKLKGKIIFARSIYIQGLIFREPGSLKGNLKQIGGYIEAIDAMALKFNISKTKLAAGYVKSLDYVDSLVVGADNPAQVAENAKLAGSPPLDEKILNEIKERLSDVPEWVFYPWLWDKQGG
jgi:aryl-alcohol dehydrogenase-like predicted oxidoreductase